MFTSWLSEELNKMCFMDGVNTSTCNQILGYDICVPVYIALSGATVVRVHHGKRKHFLYELHISIISLCFLVFNVTWTFVEG